MAVEDLRQQLPVLYEELARDIAAAAPVCDLSGRCCRFREYGHTLFLSRPEAELLLQEGLPAGSVINDASCPFQINGLCTARERRPLGCRIYYCDPRYADTGTELSEEYIGRLKQMHEAAEQDWEYRPFLHFLNEAVERAG
jgi:Fe-S-cluster containining protein